MSLRIKKVRENDEDVFTPCVICDFCNQEIESGRDGNVEWAAPQEGETSWPMFFTHKRCCLNWEDKNGGRGAWWTFELSNLPIYFLRMLFANMEEVQQVANWLTRMP